MVYNGGSVYKNYRQIQRNVDEHYQKILEVDVQLSRMRDILLKVLDGVGSKYPMKEGKRIEDLRRAIQETMSNS